MFRIESCAELWRAGDLDSQTVQDHRGTGRLLSLQLKSTATSDGSEPKLGNYL